jgi:lysozyme
MCAFCQCWKNTTVKVGIDIRISGTISWSYVDTIENKYPLHFVLFATVGKDRPDRQFKRNWLAPKKIE